MLQPRTGQAAEARKSPVAAALAACWGAFAAAGLLSGIINVLMLTGALFMLQIYDRVLPSRSVPTLVGLIVLVTALYAFQGILDFIRGRILSRVGRSLDEELNEHTYPSIIRIPIKVQAGADSLRSMRDLDQVRGFLSGLGPTALFDLPWVPIYLFVCFALHVWIGLAVSAGVILLATITVITEALTREPATQAARLAGDRITFAEASRRNAEVLHAMGMTNRLADKWRKLGNEYLDNQQYAADLSGGFGAFSRAVRMFLQSAVLAVGAYLVIYQQATPGVIIAGSILSSRALAPIELAIAHWRGFVSARQSWSRLREVLDRLTESVPVLSLPRPTKRLDVEAVSVSPPGSPKMVVQDVNFSLLAGQCLGIIGPSGSGKSSLTRAIVGVWDPMRGKVRLDGAALEQWSPQALGMQVGYLPQDVELFEGTIAENIARFEADPESGRVIAAAQAAGLHELILRLPEGYETRIGERGLALSAGQRQRVALARALFDDPFLIVLDEPNSNLDSEGDQALTQAIMGVRSRGGIVIVVAHRTSALAAADLVMAMASGRVQAFGPKNEVLQKVLRPGSAVTSLKVIGEPPGVPS